MLLMNPGTGPVAGTTRQAICNMRRFVREIDTVRRIRWGRAGPSAQENNGRAGFIMQLDEHRCFVDMPGCAMDLLVDPLRSGAVLPIRLYVDGSSWQWGYALNAARDALRIGRAE